MGWPVGEVGTHTVESDRPGADGEPNASGPMRKQILQRILSWFGTRHEMSVQATEGLKGKIWVGSRRSYSFRASVRGD